jgi:hypothetical protein
MREKSRLSITTEPDWTSSTSGTFMSLLDELEQPVLRGAGPEGTKG